MKVKSILSVCTLALATAVSANHGQVEHKIVAPTHIEAPANKPTHHWVARGDRHREHSAAPASTEALAIKLAHHWDTRDARKPYRVHSRDAGRYEYTYAEAPAYKPTHHWPGREFRNHEAASHDEVKPTATRHHARDAEKPTDRPTNDDFEDEKGETFKPVHPFATRDAREHSEPKPSGAHHRIRAIFKETTKPDAGWAGHHFARDAANPRVSKPEPMHTGGTVAGKPGHHFVRSAGRPTSNEFGTTAHPTSNPYAGTTFTPDSAISNIRGILTGGTGLKSTCDRCVAAMQVGQSLAKQSSANDFSNAVIGLCQQVKYKSKSACTSSFGPGQVGPYIQTLANANIPADGKGFCKTYFNAC